MTHLWLPYTQMKTAAAPLPVVATHGSRITLADGRELIDGIASWWTACHGYNHPHIIKAIKAQADIMPHIMLGGLVHEQAQTLAARLCALTKMDKVFFGDSGSVAVEIALKIALQYWKNTGKPHKDRFICFRNGYHGDTLGAMSVSGPEAMHKAFRNSVIKQYVVGIPADEYGFAEFDSLLAGIAGNVAGIIIEPLVQCAEGMRFHSADILGEIYRIAKKYGVLFIADEIATGFLRTGNMFACNEAGITPDIMCLGKALTGGAMTLSATLVREEIFAAFLNDSADFAFMHGPTFMGNPLACAAANASLDFFSSPLAGEQPRPSASAGRGVGGNPPTASLRTSSSLCDSPARGEFYSPHQCVEAIEAQLNKELAPCRELPNVVDVRVKGAIGVVQLDSKTIDVAGLRQKFVERGVWIRPIKDVIYLMPAFTISPDELKTLTDAIVEVLSSKNR